MTQDDTYYICESVDKVHKKPPLLTKLGMVLFSWLAGNAQCGMGNLEGMFGPIGG